ncbi:protein unc-13 homolog C-like [Saccostrea cucullata]|uniref:protein unc-13 homolog C-like n=1 Tax=Saccostrea cuccullata TaxID=36930 RepID=UPI002ED20283
MRENLLFYGVDEAPKGEQENCEDIVKRICSANLELEDDILIERAHRIGRRNNVKPRPIVAKFNRFPQRELIRKNAFKLKGTHLSIGEQFPKEIQERRKGLYPIYKKAKEDEKRHPLLKTNFTSMESYT